jgi:hypothetical protein
MSDGRTIVSPRSSLVAASTFILMLIASASHARAVSQCPSTKRAKAHFRTVAWVNTTCRTDASGLVGHQEVYVQRGDRTPVLVSQVALGPVPDSGGLCRAFGLGRDGDFSIVAGFYVGLAISPDGARVVFELNDAYSPLEHDPLTDEERGLYLASADGTRVVKLGPATSVRPFLAANGVADVYPSRIRFSPDGRYVVYTDGGFASDGSTGTQLWSLRLADRVKVQLTRLAPLPGGAGLFYVFAFADGDTVIFKTFDYDQDGSLVRQDFYSVGVDGAALRTLSPIVGPNGQVVPQFGLTGRRPAAQGLYIEGTAENPMNGMDKPRELFVAFGKNVLQLTRFNRVDMNLPVVVSRNGERVFFSQSADPFGCNPTHNCQVFSIDTLGGHLRQLTGFQETARSEVGCFSGGGPGRGCIAGLLAQDRATGSMIFTSSCDPLGTNPAGSQIFAMRADGSGLRQVTHARGMTVDTPDVVEVELPGPFAYQ